MPFTSIEPREDMKHVRTPHEAADHPHHTYTGLRVSGDEASRLLASYGWHRLTDTYDFSFTGDLLTCGDFTVSKYSHPAAEFRYDVTDAHGQPPNTMHLICLEGTFTLTTEHSSVRIETGEMIRVRADHVRHATITEPVTMLLIVHSENFDSIPGTTSRGRADPQALRFVLALAESVVMDHAPMHDTSYRLLEHAFADLCRTIIDASPLEHEPEPPSSLLQLRNEAIEMIREHSRNVDLDVNHLARLLSVSRTQLFRAFQSVGQTPAKAILDARLNTAMQLQASGYPASRVAIMAGFGNLRKLRYAARAAHAAERDHAIPEPRSKRVARNE